MPIMFYLDDQPKERCVLLRMANTNMADGYIIYLHSSMRPEALKHVRVKAVYCDSKGNFGEDDFSLKEFEERRLEK